MGYTWAFKGARMIKYTIRQINKNPDRFNNAEFVTTEDALAAMLELAKAAVDAGADKSKLMEFFDIPIS